MLARSIDSSSAGRGGFRETVGAEERCAVADVWSVLDFVLP